MKNIKTDCCIDTEIIIDLLWRKTALYSTTPRRIEIEKRRYAEFYSSTIGSIPLKR